MHPNFCIHPYVRMEKILRLCLFTCILLPTFVIMSTRTRSRKSLKLCLGWHSPSRTQHVRRWHGFLIIHWIGWTRSGPYNSNYWATWEFRRRILWCWHLGQVWYCGVPIHARASCRERDWKTEGSDLGFAFGYRGCLESERWLTGIIFFLMIFDDLIDI